MCILLKDEFTLCTRFLGFSRLHFLSGNSATLLSEGRDMKANVFNIKYLNKGLHSCWGASNNKIMKLNTTLCWWRNWCWKSQMLESSSALFWSVDTRLFDRFDWYKIYKKKTLSIMSQNRHFLFVFSFFLWLFLLGLFSWWICCRTFDRNRRFNDKGRLLWDCRRYITRGNWRHRTNQSHQW